MLQKRAILTERRKQWNAIWVSSNSGSLVKLRDDTLSGFWGFNLLCCRYANHAWRGSDQEWILSELILSDPSGKLLVRHKQATHVNKKQINILRWIKSHSEYTIWTFLNNFNEWKKWKTSYINMLFFSATVLKFDCSQGLTWGSPFIIKRCSHFLHFIDAPQLTPSPGHRSEAWQHCDRQEMLVWHTGSWMVYSTVTTFLTNHFNPLHLPDPAQINMTQHK